MRILKEDSVGVVIDIQEKLLPHIFEGEVILRNCLKLIEGLRILEIPLIVTQQYTKGLGSTVPLIIEKIPGFNFIEKISFSCYEEPSFKSEILRLGKSNIIICGIESHVCVLQTCLDLLADGLNPVVAEDSISSRKPDDKRIALERMRQEGAIVTSAESILFELTRKAGTDTFKSISKIVK